MPTEGESIGFGARSQENLRAEFAGRDLDRHLALFYESTAAQLDTVSAFLSHGLATGHRCVYLADANPQSRIEAALRDADVDVAARAAAGDLAVRDASEVYLDGGFDSSNTVTELRSEAERSAAGGYEGLWLAGENTWAFGAEKSFDEIVDFEFAFDSACPDEPVTALCQYDLRRFDEAAAAKALRTHRQVVFDGTLCENPFHVSLEAYRSGDAEHPDARLMLEQARGLAESNRELDRREERLTVLNRVLRHNIRNDLNVVQGVLTELSRSESLTAAEADRVAAAASHADAVVETAAKARYIQRTIGRSTVEPTPLRPAIERAVEEVRIEYPNARIQAPASPEHVVLADVNLDVALEEAIRNGIVHQDDPTPRVEIAVSIPTSERVRIEVQNPGSIPEHELRCLRETRETPLAHGSGLGLWLMRWIAESANGTVEFVDADDRTRVRFELYRVGD
ncbi:MEDS domain-containing protein [Halorubrum rutilum]|uniref:histidine kinase n=1 Tax=Halorubrum rutilum TaxID=1364933 RepID=A0ABD6AKT9_9EURY|nr:MEDS domain-containing protein [Halorubrum rutilum]